MTITTLSIISAEEKREQTKIAIAIKEEEKRKNREQALVTIFDQIKFAIDKTEDGYFCDYLLSTMLMVTLRINSKELEEIVDVIIALLTGAGYNVKYHRYAESTTKKNGKIGCFWIDWKEKA